MARNHIISLKVESRSQIRTINSLKKTSDEFHNGLVKVIEQTAINIQRETVTPSNFPVITGFLRSSYQTDTAKTHRDLAATVFSDAEYAPAVEFGLRQRAQPFFVPAINMHAEKYFKAIEKLIERHTK
jgi:hypothetical protein